MREGGIVSFLSLFNQKMSDSIQNQETKALNTLKQILDFLKAIKASMLTSVLELLFQITESACLILKSYPQNKLIRDSVITFALKAEKVSNKDCKPYLQKILEILLGEQKSVETLESSIRFITYLPEIANSILGTIFNQVTDYGIPKANVSDNEKDVWGVIY